MGVFVDELKGRGERKWVRAGYDMINGKESK